MIMPEIKNLVLVSEWTGDYLINDSYRPIAEQLCRKFTRELHAQSEEILFVDNLKDRKLNKGRLVFAQISVIQPKMAEIIEQMTGRKFKFIMEFFKKNMEMMAREQIIALVYHELRHIDSVGKLVDHDIADWAEMLTKIGPNWATTRASIPDLLDDSLTKWEDIEGPMTLFPRESRLEMVMPEPETEQGLAN
jgi:hypothetical protein